MKAAPSLLCLSAALAFSVQTTFAAATAKQWERLGQSLEGRLHPAVPVSAPCFDIVNGKKVGRNSTACAEVQAGYTKPEFRFPKANAYMFPQLETCQRTIETCLLDSTRPNNSAAWDAKECKQGSVSPYYIEVSSPEDVQKAFKFAKETGTFLSVKASGHDYKGRSSMPGSLSLWVSEHASTRNFLVLIFFFPDWEVEISKLRLLHVQSNRVLKLSLSSPTRKNSCLKAAKANPMLLSLWGQPRLLRRSIATRKRRSSPLSVDMRRRSRPVVAGLWQGGGHGVLSPVYGLGVDRVIQFKVVTPDGKYRVANEFQNKDLFWALRGGGGSTFGVVLESTMSVEPAMSIRVASISIPQKLENSREFLSLLINETYKWGQEGWGGHMNAYSVINVNPLLTLDEAQKSVQSVTDYALAHGGTSLVEDLPSWQAFFSKYVLSAQAVVGQPTILGGRLIPADLFTNDSGKNKVLNVTHTMLSQYGINPYIVVGPPFLYNYTEGSTSVTPAWRNSLWQIGFNRKWQFNSTAEDIKKVYQTVTEVTQLQRDIAPNSGAYFNEGDTYEPNHEVTFWGDNYPKLLQVKKKYDPLGLLDCWQCVGWRGPKDKRFSCYIPPYN
ncbi:hypothetical protein PM082_015284 [Marasmius tenuissimus]|nr:hypothetical protein PM082_015284 [Marasmius tenuissimus]